jgi:hypothetical protein
LENRITTVLNAVKHKNEIKATTTLKFKLDLINVLQKEIFNGDILEIGTSEGNTTSILCAVAEELNKKVYTFEINPHYIIKAKSLCNRLGFNNCTFIQKDVYNEEWNIANIGCVFIDCVHTEKCFEKDLKNSEIASNDPIIIAHDYGLMTKDGDGISEFLKKNSNKYDIVRFMGEHDGWNFLGSGKVIDWEGVQIKIMKKETHERKQK